MARLPLTMTSSASKCASGLLTNHPRQNATAAAFPSMRRPSGADDVSSNTVSSVKSAANSSASCRLNAPLKLSTVVRVAWSYNCIFCSVLMETSLVPPVDYRPPNRNIAHTTTKAWRFADQMRIQSHRGFDNYSEAGGIRPQSRKLQLHFLRQFAEHLNLVLCVQRTPIADDRLWGRGPVMKHLPSMHGGSPTP